MRKKILNHLDLKLLSFIIAILIWIVVANVDDYKTTKQISGIEIQFTNGSAITEKNKVYEVPEGTTIDIVIKGPRSIVEGLTKEDFKAVADLSKMSITNAVAVEVSAENSYVDKEITIVHSNNAINIAVEDKVEKQLPIMVKTSGTVADGYAISNKTAAPNLITVKGAESVINTISEVSVDVDVSKANSDIVAYGEPIFIDYAGETISSDKFEFDVKTVEVSVEVKKTKELQVKVEPSGEVKTGYQISSVDYQPTSIVVVGEPEDLERVDEIVIDDVSVLNCDADLETSVALADYLPSEISIADGTEEIMIKIMIEPLQEKILAVETDDINVIGKKEGYSYSFVDKEDISVKVIGLKDNIKNIKVTDMLPSVDVSEYGAGIYTFTINLKDTGNVTIDGEYKVEIEIKKEQ